MRKNLSILFLMCASALLAKDPRDWKQGKLLDIAMSSQMGHLDLDDLGVPVARLTVTYTVDGGDRVYQGQEISPATVRRHVTPIHIEVNAPVQYAVDKDHLYIKDSDGKSHKLDLVRTTRKD